MLEEKTTHTWFLRNFQSLPIKAMVKTESRRTSMEQSRTSQALKSKWKRFSLGVAAPLEQSGRSHFLPLSLAAKTMNSCELNDASWNKFELLSEGRHLLLLICESQALRSAFKRLIAGRSKLLLHLANTQNGCRCSPHRAQTCLKSFAINNCDPVPSRE